MPTFQPKDFIAALALSLIAILLLSGKDGTLSAAAALILGYYFAHRRNGDDTGV